MKNDYSNSFVDVDEDDDFQHFDDISELSECDSILGLGNKKKKAEKKIRKAEKALKKGNVAKAQRKLDKAIQKGAKATDLEQAGLLPKIQSEQNKINAADKNTTDFVSAASANSSNNVPNPTPLPSPVPIDPNTKADAPYTQGSGDMSTLAAQSSGGGDISEMPIDQPADDPIQDDGETGIPVTVQNETKKFPIAIVLVAIAGVIFAVIYFTKKHK